MRKRKSLPVRGGLSYNRLLYQKASDASIWLTFFLGDPIPHTRGTPKCGICKETLVCGVVMIDGKAPGFCLCEPHFISFFEGGTSEEA